jgi:hypothetical protein
VESVGESWILWERALRGGGIGCTTKGSHLWGAHSPHFFASVSLTNHIGDTAALEAVSRPLVQI